MSISYSSAVLFDSISLTSIHSHTNTQRTYASRTNGRLFAHSLAHSLGINDGAQPNTHTHAHAQAKCCVVVMAIALSHHISSVLNTLNSLANKINWKILKVINSARKTIDPFEMFVICFFSLSAAFRVLLGNHVHSTTFGER